MAWNLERTRHLFAGLTLLVLPWQARWFQEGPMLGGFPWEQGRVSIYASWLLVLGGVLLRFLSMYQSPRKMDAIVSPSSGPPVSWKNKILFFISALLLLIACLTTTSARATFQFSLEVGILILWLWSLWDLVIPGSRLALGYFITLLPSVLFGFWQYAAQMIPRIKYLGISAQDPLTRGVSVIEVAGERILRMYGTFPHPNIFAGWLVIAILAGLFVVPQMRKYWQRFLLMMGVALYTIALVLTFSRAVLIALGVGLIASMCIPQWRRLWSKLPRREIAIFIMVFIAVFGITTWQTRELWFVRAQTGTRLEQRSVNERTQSIQDGIQILRTSSLLGVGPGAELKAIQALHPTQQIPPVSPHLVWLVMLNEIGVLGFLVLVGIVGSRFYVSYRSLSMRILLLKITPVLPFLLAFGVLSCFDHYLWTLWAGKALTALGIFMIYSIFSDNVRSVGPID